MAYERTNSREPELNVLHSLLSSQHPDVVCLHGLMGVGKSALLEDLPASTTNAAAKLIVVLTAMPIATNSAKV